MHFLLRAICKLIRIDQPIGIIPLWPFNSVSKWVWDFLTFPNDKWPQSHHHDYPTDQIMQTVCVAMNSGAYIAMLAMLLTAYIFFPTVIYILSAHLIILADILDYKPKKLATLKISKQQRSKTDTERLKASSSNIAKTNHKRDNYADFVL